MLPRERWLAVVRDTPLVSIDLIVRDAAGRVLVGLRNNEPARGTWFVPGGVIRKNQTREQAFGRIAQAELGLAPPFAQARFVGVYEHLYDSNCYLEPGFGTHYVVLAYALDNLTLPDQLPDEQHRDYRWLTPDQLVAAADVHPYTKAYFEGMPQ